MRANEIVVGGCYKAKVNGYLTVVRVDQATISHWRKIVDRYTAEMFKIQMTSLIGGAMICACETDEEAMKILPEHAMKVFNEVIQRVQGNRPLTSVANLGDKKLMFAGCLKKCLEILGEK